MFNHFSLFERYISKNPNELSKEQILNLEHEIKHPDPNTISDEFLDFKLWCIGYPSRQERFAEYLANKLTSKTKILEVGCGKTARLSRFLSQKNFYMTAMDPKITLSDCDTVTFIKDSFNKSFDVSMYDYVIAQEPCDATEHIVRACTACNTSFIMSLCGVPHKLLSGKMPKSSEEWYNYLTTISPTLKLRYINFDPFTTTVILKNF